MVHFALREEGIETVPAQNITSICRNEEAEGEKSERTSQRKKKMTTMENEEFGEGKKGRNPFETFRRAWLCG
ncbi:hypothetical protein WH47_05380 [Habropoda laboriosa]|uniref:Uncharacterized protein n=1 Tax=Habropoda laboriosa TaxID=597456 RepID=A0A0L7RK68_9HYME|nr:hypothetical protein WH47_05380 [Habropoda laboriosa]